MIIEVTRTEFNDGTSREIYHRKGRIDYLHRVDGPAIIWYNVDGSEKKRRYWLYNRPVSAEVFLKRCDALYRELI